MTFCELGVGRKDIRWLQGKGQTGPAGVPDRPIDGPNERV